MDMKTGEIIENPSEQQMKDESLIALDPKEAAFVRPYPPEQRLCALHWWHYIARKDVIFGNMVEKMKAKKAFFEAWELAQEAKQDGLRIAE